MATVRVEWLKIDTVSGSTITSILGSAEYLTANTSSAVTSNTAPVANNTGCVARVTAVDGALVVTSGLSPTLANETQGVRLETGQAIELKAQSGWVVKALQSTTASTAATNLSVDTLNLNTDGLETLAANTNALLNTMINYANASPVQLVDANNTIIPFTDPASVRTFLANTSGLTEARINISASGNTTLIANVASQSIRVFRMRLHTSNLTNITLYSNTTVLEAWDLGDKGGFSLDLTSEPQFTCGVNEPFILNSSATANIQGRIYYTRS